MDYSMFDDDGDEEALRLAALKSLQKPKSINTHNLIPIVLDPFIEKPTVKLEPISPSRESKFYEEKKLLDEKKEKEIANKTDDDLSDEDDSFEGLLDQLQASIEGRDKKKEKKEEEEVEFLDVKTNKRSPAKEIVILESPPLSPRPTYRSRSRSRRRSWSRSPRPRRYTLSRSPSPRYRRRRSSSWSPSPKKARSPYRRRSRSPRRRWSRSPRPRSRTPVRKRSPSPRRSPRRRSRSRTPPPRISSRSPINRARKRDSPVRRRSLSPRRPRPRPIRRSEEKRKDDEISSDPVLEARRRKFESVPNPNKDKKISLKAVKDTIEPVNNTGLDLRNAFSDDSENSDEGEGRFKSNKQAPARASLMSFRNIREGTTVVPPARLEPSQPNRENRRCERKDRIRLRKEPEKRAASPKIKSPAKIQKVSENNEKPESARISVKKDLFENKVKENKEEVVPEPEPDLRKMLVMKRLGSGVLPLQSRLVQSALQNLGEPKVKTKQSRRVLVIDNIQPVSIQPKPAGPKRRVRKVQDLEPISLSGEDTEPEEIILQPKRKLKVKRSVTIASQVTN